MHPPPQVFLYDNRVMCREPLSPQCVAEFQAYNRTCFSKVQADTINADLAAIPPVKAKTVTSGAELLEAIADTTTDEALVLNNIDLIEASKQVG